MAFIANISFPKSLDEVEYFIKVRGKFDVQEILEETYVEWTVPKDARQGETVYFMHSKTSIDTIRRLKRELAAIREDIDIEDVELLANALHLGEELYQCFGGSIFAEGKVCGELFVDRVAIENGLHWRSKYYAPIDSVRAIESPINIAEFRSFITISQTGAITKLTADQNNKLRDLRNLN